MPLHRLCMALPFLNAHLYAAATVDEYYMTKRTQALQLFMLRCARHPKIRDHPMFRHFLEVSSPVCALQKTSAPPLFNSWKMHFSLLSRWL